MNTTPADSWLGFIRTKELDMALANLKDMNHGLALELGCGNGTQSRILSRRFNLFISSDIKDQRKYLNNTRFVVCDAQWLPFKNNIFDFIFSSNLLEHIHLKDQCLLELKRILKKNGLMVHTVPTITWKMLFLSLHYFAMFKLILTKIFNIGNGREDKNSNVSIGDVKGSNSKKFMHYLRVISFPMVHGAYRNNIVEFLNYRKNVWISLFLRNGYKIKDIINLYFYSPYMFFKFRFLKLRQILGKSVITSCRAFVVSIE